MSRRRGAFLPIPNPKAHAAEPQKRRPLTGSPPSTPTRGPTMQDNDRARRHRRPAAHARRRRRRVGLPESAGGVRLVVGGDRGRGHAVGRTRRRGVASRLALDVPQLGIGARGRGLRGDGTSLSTSGRRPPRLRGQPARGRRGPICPVNRHGCRPSRHARLPATGQGEQDEKHRARVSLLVPPCWRWRQPQPAELPTCAARLRITARTWGPAWQRRARACGAGADDEPLDQLRVACLDSL